MFHKTIYYWLQTAWKFTDEGTGLVAAMEKQASKSDQTRLS